MKSTIYQMSPKLNSLAVALAAVVALAVPAQAVGVVYNVLTGQNRQAGGSAQILPTDNVVGPADLSAPNQTWNGFSDSNLTGTLKTSTGTVTTVTFTAGTGGEWGSQGGTGSPIYTSYVYAPNAASFGGLDPASTYDVYVLASSYWGDRGYISVTQTAGSGLTGTFSINRNGNPPADPLSFLRDTDPSTTQGNFDYALFTGLTPSAGGDLSFSLTSGGRDGGSIAGYQLVEAVPEPSSMLLLGCGMLGAFVRRRRS